MESPNQHLLSIPVEILLKEGTMTVSTNSNNTLNNSNTGTDSELKLIQKKDYILALRKHLKEEELKPNKKELIHYFIYMSIYCAGVYCIISTQLVLPRIFISIILGITLASLLFFLHDLMHGAILKSKCAMYLTGFSVGLLIFFSPTFWQRIHNFHHAMTGNMMNDPDRMYIWNERPENLFEVFIYKMRISNEAFHPLISLVSISTGFFWYFLFTIFYSFFPGRINPKKQNKYKSTHELFKIKDKLIVALELLLIFLFQGFLFFIIANRDFLNYSLISLLPLAIAHAIAMLYIHTNHFLSPLTGNVVDPLINSLSIKNSKIVDKVFSNFSHHVEHHLFPSISSSHYPKIRKLLIKLYPGRFQLMSMLDAIKSLFNTPIIYVDNTRLVTLDGKRKYNCLMPSTQ